jgi:GT2 family glycosyltransferase
MNENIYLTEDKHKRPNDTNDIFLSIIILTYNNLLYTRKTLASIKKYTKLPYEVIIVDNASTDSTVEYLKNNSNLIIIFNEKNLGFPAGCNQGISIAKGKYILILNNDVIVTENWVANMIHYFKNPQVGIVVPITNKISGDQKDYNCPQYKMTIKQVEKDGDDIIQGYAIDNFIKRKGLFVYTNIVTGFCMLITRKVIETIGGFDERFGIGNFEDCDYSIRAVLASYKIVIAKDIFIYHFGSQSFSLMPNETYTNIIQENRIKFAEKYGEDLLVLQKDISKITKEVEIKFDINYSLDVFSNHKKLLVCIIVQNDITCIKKTMDSIVDIAKEIIVLNYGSQDDLEEKIYMYDSKIININNNEYNISKYLFNESDWVFILNSGEEIDDEAAVKVLQYTNNKNVDAYSITINNYLKEDSFYKFDTYCQVRLLKNKNEYDYLNKQFGSILEFNKFDKQIIADITIKSKEIDMYWLKNLEVVVLEKLLKDDSSNLDYIYKLAARLHSLDKYEESIKHLLFIIELYNKNNDLPLNRKIEDVFLLLYHNYYKLKNYKESDKYIKYLEKNSIDDLNIKFTIAINYYHKNELNKSIALFEELVVSFTDSENPKINYHFLYLTLSNLYYDIDNIQKSIKYVQKAISFKQDSAIAFYAYGRLLHKVRLYEEATQLLSFALEYDPDFSEAKELLESIKSKK